MLYIVCGGSIFKKLSIVLLKDSTIESSAKFSSKLEESRVEASNRAALLARICSIEVVGLRSTPMRKSSIVDVGGDCG